MLFLAKIFIIFVTGKSGMRSIPMTTGIFEGAVWRQKSQFSTMAMGSKSYKMDPI